MVQRNHRTRYQSEKAAWETFFKYAHIGMTIITGMEFLVRGLLSLDEA